MTVGPSPGILEDFGAVRSSAAQGGEAPDGAPAPGGAAGLFDDLVDAWLTPAAQEDDADDPAEVPADAVATAPFAIVLPLPLPVAVDVPQTSGDAVADTESATVPDRPSKAESPASDSTAGGGLRVTSEAAIDPAKQRSDDAVVQSASDEHAADDQRAADRQPAAPVREVSVPVATTPASDERASESADASGKVARARYVRDLPGLTNGPATTTAGAQTPNENAPAIAASKAARVTSPVLVASPAVAEAKDEIKITEALPATIDAASAPIDAAAQPHTQIDGSANAKDPSEQPASQPSQSGELPRRAVGVTRRDPSHDVAPAAKGSAQKPQPAATSPGVPAAADPTAAVAEQTPSTETQKPIGMDARKADAPRHESTSTAASQWLKPPVVHVLEGKPTERSAPGTPVLLAEIGVSRTAAALAEPSANDGLRGSGDRAGAPVSSKSGNDAGESGEREANRESRRDTAEQAPIVTRSIASAPFVERAESRDASGPSQAARPPVTVVHGTAPVLTQATLIQPPAVTNSEVPATATPAPDTADRIVQSLKLQVQKGGGDAVLHLQPDHLGPVAISLRVENGAVTAVITAEHPAVAEWLQSNQQLLRDSLQSSGLQLERFVVQRDGQSPSDRQRREWVESRRRDFRRRSPQSDSTFEISV